MFMKNITTKDYLIKKTSGIWILKILQATIIWLVRQVLKHASPSLTPTTIRKSANLVNLKILSQMIHTSCTMMISSNT